MNISFNDRNRRCNQSGFSLIELMISMVIGLLGVLVIFQVMSVWDSRRRTTASGSDAQVAGTIGAFALERDLKVVGYGLGRISPTEWGCPVKMRTAAGGSTTFSLLPVMITQGASGAPDTLATLYGNSSYFAGQELFTSSTATTKRTTYRTGLFPGDILVLTNAPLTAATANCELIEVTSDVVAGDDRAIEHAATSYTRFGSTVTMIARFNPVGGTGATFTRGNIYNLGPTPRRTQWDIRTGGILSATDLLGTGGTVDVADGVVDLQAEYGVVTNTAAGIGGPTTWSDTAPALWTDLWAVRVAILSRSQQFEKEPTTTVAPSFFGGTRQFSMGNVFGAAASDAPGDPANWRHYRYRVYEKVVPLRNIMWGRAQPS